MSFFRTQYYSIYTWFFFFLRNITHCFFDKSVTWREKEMATHSSTPAWKIPWTEEPGRLQSMGSWRVGHDCATSFSLFTLMHWRRKWQPTPVFLPEGSQGQGAWRAAVYGVAQSQTRLKWLSSSSNDEEEEKTDEGEGREQRDCSKQKRVKSCDVPLKCIVWSCLDFDSGASVIKRDLLEAVIEYPVLNHIKELLYFTVWNNIGLKWENVYIF